MNDKLSKLNISLDHEVVTNGQNLNIVINSSVTLKSLSLFLPFNPAIELKVSPNQTDWFYSWKVPTTIPAGMVKIKVIATDKDGKKIEQEINCIILR